MPGVPAELGDMDDGGAVLHQAEPGALAARAARASFDEVLGAIPDLPFALDRAFFSERLLRGIHFTYAAIDAPTLSLAHLDALRHAAAIAAETRALLREAAARDRSWSTAPAEEATDPPALERPVARLDAAERALLDAAERVTAIHFERRGEVSYAAPPAVGDPPPPRPFRASNGVPSLHAFLRPRIVPRFVSDADSAPLSPDVLPLVVGSADGPPAAPAAPDVASTALPVCDDVAALKALAAKMRTPEWKRERLAPTAAPAPAPVPATAATDVWWWTPAVEEVEVLRRLARDALENLASFRTLRHPNAMETWLDQAPFEQRILDQLDAWAACGPTALSLVSLFLAEAKTPDPERAFAAALSLGSIDGRDTAAAALMLFKQSAPETYEGWLEGFTLAPHPELDAFLIELAESARPAWVAFGLDALHARGTTPDRVIRALASGGDHPLARDEAIAWRVCRALASCLPHVDAVAALESTLALTEDDAVFLAALESLLRRGHAPALRDARAVATKGSSRRATGALVYVALAGSASDVERLAAAAREDPTPALVRALGRFGHPAMLNVLLPLLDHGDPATDEIVAAAAEALDRITGAGLREIVEEDWEVELPPEAADVGALPMPKRRVEKVVTDGATWREWIRKNEKRFTAAVKYRGGGPFAPVQIVDELAAKNTPPARREDAALELALVTGLRSRFSPEGWVARQIAQLADLRERTGALGAAPGQWSFALERATRGSVGAETAADARAPSETASAARSQAAQASAAAPPTLPTRPAEGPAPARELPSFMRAAAGAAPATSAASPPVAPVVAAPAHLTTTRIAPVSPRPPPEETIDAGDDDDPPAITAKPLPVQGAVLPFRPTTTGVAPARVAGLTLFEYAELCVATVGGREEAAALFERLGLADPRAQQAADRAWRQHLAQHPEQMVEWQRLYAKLLGRPANAPAPPAPGPSSPGALPAPAAPPATTPVTTTAAPAAPAAPAQALPTLSVHGGTGAIDVREVLRGGALPFPPARPPEAPALPTLSVHGGTGAIDIREVLRGFAMPFPSGKPGPAPAPAPPPAPTPHGTLEDHADLRAEMGAAPARAEAALTRRGLLTQAQRTAYFAAWKSYLDAHPQEHRRWQELYAARWHEHARSPKPGP